MSWRQARPGSGRRSSACSPTAAGPSASRSTRSPWCPPSRGRAGARSGSTCCTRCSPSCRTRRRSRPPRSRRRASSSARRSSRASATRRGRRPRRPPRKRGSNARRGRPPRASSSGARASSPASRPRPAGPCCNSSIASASRCSRSRADASASRSGRCTGCAPCSVRRSRRPGATRPWRRRVAGRSWRPSRRPARRPSRRATRSSACPASSGASACSGRSSSRRRFAQSGSDVLFARHSFGAQLSTRQAEPGIEEIELPGVPGTNPYRDRMGDEEAHRAADALLGHLVGRGVGRFVCVVQLPFWAPLAARLREVAGCDVVYDCMDLHAGFSSNSAEALADEARLFAEADVVVCSAELLAEHARPHAKAVAMVRNGVDYDHFAAVPDREPGRGPSLTVGYYGAIADWFDSALVAGIARLRPQWRIVLIGSTWSADIAPLEAAANVVLAGEKPYAELPALIADWDCCVIPFQHSPLTAATNPVKVYEMLAAGKPVVSVGLPELASMAAEGLVSLAEGAEALRRGDRARRRGGRCGVAREPARVRGVEHLGGAARGLRADDRGDRAAGVDRRGDVQQPRAQRAVPAQRARRHRLAGPRADRGRQRLVRRHAGAAARGGEAGPARARAAQRRQPRLRGGEQPGRRDGARPLPLPSQQRHRRARGLAAHAGRTPAPARAAGAGRPGDQRDRQRGEDRGGLPRRRGHAGVVGRALRGAPRPARRDLDAGVLLRGLPARRLAARGSDGRALRHRHVRGRRLQPARARRRASTSASRATASSTTGRRPRSGCWARTSTCGSTARTRRVSAPSGRRMPTIPSARCASPRPTRPRP